MSELNYNFEIAEAEYSNAVVYAPQLLIMHLDVDVIKVVIYFMANTAVEITNGIAKSKMGRIALSYQAKSSSGAYCASVNLRKIIFTFNKAQGLTNNFVFEGERK